MQLPVSYAQDCVLLRAVSRTLQLPPSAACTALVFLHQGRHSEDPWTLAPEDLVSAAIWAACKAEEVNCSSNQLINTLAVLSGPQGGPLIPLLARTPAHWQQPQGPADAGAPTPRVQHAPHSNCGDHVPLMAAAPAGPPSEACHDGSTEQLDLHAGAGACTSSHATDSSSQQPQQQQHQAEQQQQQPGQAEGPGPPSGTRQPSEPPVVLAEQQALEASASALTGTSYYAAKQQLFTAEQHLLRRLRFQLVTPQPHAYLLNLVNLVRPAAAASVAATCLLNDALVYTDCVVTHPPEVLAVAALAAAEQCLQAPGLDAGLAGAVEAGEEQETVPPCSEAAASAGSGAQCARPPSSNQLPPWVDLLDVPVEQVVAVRQHLMRLWRLLQQSAPGTDPSSF